MTLGAAPVSPPVATATVSIETYVALDNAAEECGRASARRMTSDQEIATTLQEKLKIPGMFDGRLLREVANTIGATELTVDQKRVAREGFWIGFESEIDSSQG